MKYFGIACVLLMGFLLFGCLGSTPSAPGFEEPVMPDNNGVNEGDNVGGNVANEAPSGGSTIAVCSLLTPSEVESACGKSNVYTLLQGEDECLYNYNQTVAGSEDFPLTAVMISVKDSSASVSSLANREAFKQTLLMSGYQVFSENEVGDYSVAYGLQGVEGMKSLIFFKGGKTVTLVTMPADAMFDPGAVSCSNKLKELALKISSRLD
ncbi:MAG: hypothetical protein V1644_02930 [Candidatus Micrarchaeota archaeon]